MPFPFQSVSTLHLFFLNCKSFLLFHDISQTENFQKSAKPETFTKPSLLSHVQVDVLFQMKPAVNDSLIHIFRRHRHRLDAVVGNVLGPVINGIRHPQLGAGSGNILSLSQGYGQLGRLFGQLVHRLPSTIRWQADSSASWATTVTFPAI